LHSICVSRTDLEEITHKTGSFKRFGVFASMIRGAILGSSDSLSLDLLTASDLELLKSKRLRAPAPADGAAAPPSASSKRYLIITYVAEYDRVHYPLPLAFERPLSAEQMRGQMRELRAELDAMRRTGGSAPADAARLERENAELRAKLERRAADAHAAERRLGALGEIEASHDTLRRHNARLEEALEELRREAAREIRAIKRECAQLADARGGAAADASEVDAERRKADAAAAEAKRMRRQAAALEQAAREQRETHARELRRVQRERDAALLDAQRARDSEAAARLKLRSAASELAWLKTKGGAGAGAGTGGRGARLTPRETPLGSRASSRASSRAPSRASSLRGGSSREPSPVPSRGSTSPLRPARSGSSAPRLAASSRSGSAPSSARRPAPPPSRPVSPHLYQPRNPYAREPAAEPRLALGSRPASAPTSRAGSTERARPQPSGLLGSRSLLYTDDAPSPLGRHASASAPRWHGGVTLAQRSLAERARTDGSRMGSELRATHSGRPPAPRPPPSRAVARLSAADCSADEDERLSRRAASARAGPRTSGAISSAQPRRALPSESDEPSEPSGTDYEPSPAREPPARAGARGAARPSERGVAQRRTLGPARAAAPSSSHSSTDSDEPEPLVRARAHKENSVLGANHQPAGQQPGAHEPRATPWRPAFAPLLASVFSRPLPAPCCPVTASRLTSRRCQAAAQQERRAERERRPRRHQRHRLSPLRAPRLFAQGQGEQLTRAADRRLSIGRRARLTDTDSGLPSMQPA
jgi:coiled-coil domain-containing protein 61